MVGPGPGWIREEGSTLLGMDQFFAMVHVLVKDAFWPSEDILCLHDLISELCITSMLFLKRSRRAIKLNKLWPTGPFLQLV